MSNKKIQNLLERRKKLADELAKHADLLHGTCVAVRSMGHVIIWPLWKMACSGSITFAQQIAAQTVHDRITLC